MTNTHDHIDGAGAVSPSAFLEGGGEAGALIAAFDWAATSLGPIETWPQCLKTATAILLRSPVPIVMLWGEDGRMIYNDAYSGFAGGRHPELLGSKVREGWPEVADFNDNVMKVGLAGDTLAYKDQELTLYRSGAPEQVWMNLDYSPVLDERGRPAGVIAVVIETTERVAAERRLRESEARFRNMADHAPVMMWVTDPSASCLYLNRKWHDYTGQTPAEAQGFGWLEAVHPDDRTLSADIFLAANAAHEPFRLEYRLRRRDGAYRWAIDAASPRFGEDGDFLGYIGSVIDIDERHEAEARLRELNETLEERVTERTAERNHLWTLTEDMLARADYGGAMSAVNPAWTKVLGWSEHELLTNPYADIIHPEDVGVTVAALLSMGETKRPTRFENRILTAGGEWKPIGWTVSPEPDGVNFFAVGRDLADYRAREQELLQTQEKLRQSQKMEAVGQLTGGIAHDFNNMLAVVIGGLNLLERRLAKGDTNVGRYVEAAMEGAKRAASLTQRLLAFSRQQPLDPVVIDANRLVAGMTELLSRTLGEPVRVESVLMTGLWKLRADLSQLENALLNLAVNARDAMENGGRLTIETANTYSDENYARAHGVPPGQYVLIAVSDTGMGMSPDTLARAFDPFFTTKTVGKGTGLGLSQVFGFVRQSGGHVKLYSEVRHGTTVKIYLPRHYEDQASSREGAAAAAGPRDGGRDEIVLVVEDEERVRAFSVEALRDLGYSVIEATNAAEALRIVERGDRVTLLFTDVVMPEMTGRQLADAVLAIRPDLKVLYTTGYTRNAVVHNGVLDPGTHLLPKPFSLDQLAAKVRAVLDG